MPGEYLTIRWARAFLLIVVIQELMTGRRVSCFVRQLLKASPRLENKDIWSRSLPQTAIYGNMTLVLTKSMNVPTPSYVQVLTQGILSITSFSLLRKGSIMQFDLNDMTRSRKLHGEYLWPNELAMFKDKTGQPILLIPDGFLLPGQCDGGLYAIRNPHTPQAHSVRITEVKEGWFYHRAAHVRLPGGAEGILTARAKKPLFGRGRGELVWLSVPSDIDAALDLYGNSDHSRNNSSSSSSGRGSSSSADTGSSSAATATSGEDYTTSTTTKNVKSSSSSSSTPPSTPVQHAPWVETILAEGPDVMFEVADLDPSDDCVEVVAAHFFGEKISVHSIRSIPYPPYIEISETRTLDTVGRPYGLCLATMTPPTPPTTPTTTPVMNTRRSSSGETSSSSSSSSRRRRRSGSRPGTDRTSTAVTGPPSTTTSLVAPLSAATTESSLSPASSSSLQSSSSLMAASVDKQTPSCGSSSSSSNVTRGEPLEQLAWNERRKFNFNSDIHANANVLGDGDSDVEAEVETTGGLCDENGLIVTDRSTCDNTSPTHLLVTTHECSYDIASAINMALSAIGGFYPRVKTGAASGLFLDGQGPLSALMIDGLFGSSTSSGPGGAFSGGRASTTRSSSSSSSSAENEKRGDEKEGEEEQGKNKGGKGTGSEEGRGTKHYRERISGGSLFAYELPKLFKDGKRRNIGSSSRSDSGRQEAITATTANKATISSSRANGQQQEDINKPTSSSPSGPSIYPTTSSPSGPSIYPTVVRCGGSGEFGIAGPSLPHSTPSSSSLGRTPSLVSQSVISRPLGYADELKAKSATTASPATVVAAVAAATVVASDSVTGSRGATADDDNDINNSSNSNDSNNSKISGNNMVSTSNSVESLSQQQPPQPSKKQLDWPRRTLFRGFKVSGWGGIFSPGAPGFPYVFRMPNKPQAPPLILLAGDCTGSAYVFAPKKRTAAAVVAIEAPSSRRASKFQAENKIDRSVHGGEKPSSVDTLQQPRNNSNNAAAGNSSHNEHDIDSDIDEGSNSMPEYELAFEIQCGATVGSAAVAAVPDDSGDVDIFVPSYELNQVHVFRLSDTSS